MRATARAQPNIALIKYWGKRDTRRNLPAVGSISITLSELFTEMTVEFDGALDRDHLRINGKTAADMLPRISRCLDDLAGMDRQRARVQSRCNFPIAAGLASSASAFAALVVAAAGAAGQRRSRAELAGLACRASGSAARSLYGGFVELENSEGSDIAVASLREAGDWPLEVVVAITEPGRKPIGSGQAMQISRETSPFYGRWVDGQPADLEAARLAIAERDFERLAAVAEHNCLKMHSVMWASRPSIVYWNSATISCLQTVRQLQSKGIPVFFTIDAGPQVKAVCAADAIARVARSLAETDGVRDVMLSGLGRGASRVNGC